MSSSGTVTEKQYDFQNQEMKLQANNKYCIPPIFFRKWKWSPVLIVEDQPINTMILRDFWSILGVKSDDAENGEVAIDRWLERYDFYSH